MGTGDLSRELRAQRHVLRDRPATDRANLQCCSEAQTIDTHVTSSFNDFSLLLACRAHHIPERGHARVPIFLHAIDVARCTLHCFVTMQSPFAMSQTSSTGTPEFGDTSRGRGRRGQWVQALSAVSSTAIQIQHTLPSPIAAKILPSHQSPSPPSFISIRDSDRRTVVMTHKHLTHRPPCPHPKNARQRADHRQH